jgi:hypothetical protein
MTKNISKRHFLRVEVTRDDPRSCSPRARWSLFADRYASKTEAENAVERALTAGDYPYRAARVIEEYSVENGK